MTTAGQETFLQRQLRKKAEREAAERAAQGERPAPASTGTAALAVGPDNPRAARWLAQKVAAQLEEVRSAPEGTRNDTLNRAAYSLGRRVPAYLDEEHIAQQLLAAARDVGLEHREATLTIRSGLSKGMSDPLPVTLADPEPGADLAGLVAGPVSRPAPPGVDPVTGEVLEAPQVPALDVADEDAALRLPPFSGLDLRRLDGPLPPLDWQIEGRMTRRTLTLLGSKPGVGKSWLAQSAALAVAQGGLWLGHPARPGRVLYLDAENGDNLALRRLQQLGATADQLDDRLRYVTESMVFPDARDTYRLRRTLEEFAPDLVVVDTLASIAPTAEAGTEEASTFLAAVWHAVRDAGASMLLLCHLRKVMQGAGKDDPLASFRGAGHLVGAAHRAWVLDPVSDSAFVLRDVKTREFAACPPVRVRLVDSGEGQELRTVVEVEGEVEQLEDGYDAYLANVLTLIDNHPTGAAKTADLLSLTAGSETRRTLERYLTRALSAGVLAKAGRGLWKRGGARLEDEATA